ncbi:hypothetical protein BaRGS_00016326 [Batillaria attramentaria]|uniref:Uncharacterized protein n=1 Tax=Batillaria attramentaria TaxID=370345 RepID=A0ABD0KZU3_9CAEN
MTISKPRPCLPVQPTSRRTVACSRPGPRHTGLACEGNASRRLYSPADIATTLITFTARSAIIRPTTSPITQPPALCHKRYYMRDLGSLVSPGSLTSNILRHHAMVTPRTKDPTRNVVSAWTWSRWWW